LKLRLEFSRTRVGSCSLLHYLDKLVYPDISAIVLTIAEVIICALNLALYGRQMGAARLR
jgi:hypothetical protein